MVDFEKWLRLMLSYQHFSPDARLQRLIDESEQRDGTLLDDAELDVVSAAHGGLPPQILPLKNKR